MNSNDFSGTVVLVTGAGSGLGEATARAFAGAGAIVACADINRTAAQRVAADLGANSVAIGCDVRDAEAVAATVGEVVGRFGRLDVLVNNAAIDHTASITELSVEQWDAIVAVNLRGPFLFARAAFPVMQRQKAGHIVNIASTAGLRAWANAAPYHATKWGIIGLGRSLGVEGRPDNIRVTTIIPGGMRTHFFDRFEAQGIPMPDQDHLQDPANVAESILFAVRMSGHSVVQELMITPMTETSWP